jgi:rod shape-determining protein MreC
LLRLEQLEQENRHLRSLLEARERQPVKSTVAEIMYTAKDPFSRKVILDKGAQAGIEAGQAVVDDAGVVGQITRVFPMQSELTLLTDKDQAIPVMVVRSGLQGGAVRLGRRADGAALPGRQRRRAARATSMVTSGLDGVYPGRIAGGYRFSRSSATMAQILCAHSVPARSVRRRALYRHGAGPGAPAAGWSLSRARATIRRSQLGGGYASSRARKARPAEASKRACGCHHIRAA